LAAKTQLKIKRLKII